MELISFILKHGMPQIPDGSDEKTYVEEMEEWKRKIKVSVFNDKI